MRNTLLTTLIALKIKNPRLYQDFVGGKANHQDVLQYIGATTAGSNFLMDNYGVALQIQLEVCRPGKTLNELEKCFKDMQSNTGFSQEERDKAEAKADLARYYSFNSRGVEGCLGYLIQKIDLVSQFEE